MPEWRPNLDAAGRHGPKYRALGEALAADIENGTLPPGTRLPTHRDLAYRLGISVQTVSTAYKEAERQGLLRSEVGRGTFVRHRPSEGAASQMLDRRASDLVDLSTVRAVYTPRHAELFSAAMRELAEAREQPWMRACRPVAGFDEHREVGAAWLARFGLSASPDQILVTNGASHGIFLALATLVQPGDVVVTEALTDHGVIGAASVLRFSLRGLPIDGEGILPDAFAEACRAGKVRALVCTPVFNNPTGALMGVARRRAVAAIAEQHGVHVIEDDVFHPLLETPLPAIASFLPSLGWHSISFTKAGLTGLRTGYLTVPHQLAIRASSVLRVSGWMGTLLMAEIAMRWLRSGVSGELFALQRTETAARQALVAEVLGSAVAGTHPHALSAWMRLPRHWTERAFVRALRHRQVAVTASDPFLVGEVERPNAVRLCIGGELSLSTLRHALEVIAQTRSQLPSVHEGSDIGDLG
jgi:DNA-binding transcriptional MocR family regulator